MNIFNVINSRYVSITKKQLTLTQRDLLYNLCYSSMIITIRNLLFVFKNIDNSNLNYIFQPLYENNQIIEHDTIESKCNK